ncbi:hypothetical protein GHU73_20290 [Citrobacter werkmanii]|nr:hypothetical protein [Citrobacter werkmanii]MBJ9599679.1 hypothetical protein [Citrobacter werkmanii]
MKPTYEELEKKCALQQSKLAALNELMGVVENAGDIAKAGIEGLQSQNEELASRLANAESKCRELAAENVYLLPKAASELSNAWVLHKYLIGIQAAIMYLDGGSKKAAQEWLYGTIAGPGFEFPDEVEVGDDIDAWATHQMRDSISHPRALEIIKAETPATDAFLAEVRAQGVEMFSEKFGGGTLLSNMVKETAKEFAAHLRQGAAL